MRKTPILVALALTALLAAGCSSTSADPAASAPAAVTQVSAPAAPERVDAPYFAAAVATPGVVVLDVRTPEEYATGYISGAVNIDAQGADFAAQVGTLDPEATYAVYCRSGNRSAGAVAAMSAAGIQHVYELESGIVGWQEAGYPLEG
ncbi:MAG: rhodanese-like domain-containing protein [Actinomycetota bacterium]|nr:rhodanese-like domain-containing protein [Actinomycetota bacterium]